MNRFAILAVLFSTAAFGQLTISPLNSEHGKKARGEFTITNGTFSAIPVTIEPLSVVVHDGKFELAELSSSVHLKLSEFSTRIPAKQNHVFGYSATCDTYPCSFALFATFATGGHTDTGVAVAVRLGTVIYACEKERGCRQSMQP